MTDKPVSFPFRSSAAYSRAAEILARGSWSVSDPHDEENAKPDGFQIEELLWEIGRSQQLRINELLDAHELIPEMMAPRADTTSGAKTTLAERVQVILQRMEKAEASLKAVTAAAPNEGRVSREQLGRAADVSGKYIVRAPMPPTDQWTVIDRIFSEEPRRFDDAYSAQTCRDELNARAVIAALGLEIEGETP